MKRLITVGLLLAVLAGGIFASHAQTISCNGIPGNFGMIQTSCGAGATNYYVANGGSDSNNGLTPATAWQTITHVNAQTFSTPSIVNFNGGQTFTGGLAFTTSNVTHGNITVQSYGTGQATFSSGNSTACVTATDVPSVTVNNIICTGGGAGTNTTNGIYVVNDTTSLIAGPTITNDTVSAYGLSGIRVTSTNATANGFSGTTINFNTVTNVTGNSTVAAVSCISVDSFPNGYQTNPNSNVTITHNTVSNCTGTASATQVGVAKWTGSGIVVAETNGATVEFNIAHDTGANNNACGGPAGIWTTDAANIHIRFNESYNNKTNTGGGGCDGHNFDIDSGVSSSDLMFNYSHGAAGCGYLMDTGATTVAWSNNTAAWNISQNDADGICVNAPSGVSNPTMTGCKIYQNTAVGNGASYQAFSNYSTTAAGFTSDCIVSNNIFYDWTTAGFSVHIGVPSSMVLTGNDYYGNGTISWSGTGYSTFGAWQTATGQEKIGGVNVGHTVEPQLVVFGGGPTSGIGYTPASLSQYQLQTASPMIAAGLNLTTQYGINPGTTDYFGNAISASSLPIGAGQAVNWTSGTGTCSQATSFLGRATTPVVGYQQWVNGLICGLVADGTFSQLDYLYDFEADTQTNAKLNLLSSSFPLTVNGSCTFTANGGYTGDASTCFISSTYNPHSGTNWTQNNAGLGVCVLNARSTPSATSYVEAGLTDGTSYSLITLIQGLSLSEGNMNETLTVGASFTGTNTQGDWLIARTGASAETFYQNAASVATATTSSNGVPNAAIYFLAANAAGSAIDFSPDTVGFEYGGIGANAAGALLIHSRIDAASQQAGQGGC